MPYRRMMATILNEGYLSFGFASRHITRLPYDKQDADCHVITAPFSDSLSKWPLMDPMFEAHISSPEGEILGPLGGRERSVAEDPIVVNPGINRNGAPCYPDAYLLYLTKNVFRFSCPIRSEFGCESKEGPRSWVHLNPEGDDDDAEAEYDSTGSYVVDCVTQSALQFWAAPNRDQRRRTASRVSTLSPPMRFCA
ncbi:MAG: hypothetical protein GF346_03495 [Candidatus Eisenbacteria bacterium]|nr:hypothetical protein [Candidatus Latescibacterota bacterium]MBD3301487.1 hypothetical protein [Candidatus Eisenbacteria bacterium]